MTQVVGQQYEYDFDDIGNRKTATVNSHIFTYRANDVNQYTNRTVVGKIDIIGSAHTDAT